MKKRTVGLKKKKRKISSVETGTDTHAHAPPSKRARIRKSESELKENEGKLADLPSDEKKEKRVDWDSLKLNKSVRMAIHEMGFESMMPVQAECIPLLLAGESVVGAAKTGSGKTVAFLVPIIEKIMKTQWDPDQKGVCSLVIAPTRELAIQIRQVALALCKFDGLIKIGLLIGGNPRPSDVVKIIDGMHLCIGTPGRVLDHLMRTPEFVVSNLSILCLDECDRILDEGYQDELNEILKRIPKERQNMLFSATQTRKTGQLIRVSFARKPHLVVVEGEGEGDDSPTRGDLKQGFIMVPTDKKFLLLFTFLKKYWKKKKMVVFLSTVNATKYLVELLNYIDIKVHGLFGSMSQRKRTETYLEFAKCRSGVLLATNVAARGLDLPDVDWIIQYDPCDDLKTYVHRVGRTCRGVLGEVGEKGRGKALLFLIPDESRYLTALKKKKICSLFEYEFDPAKMANIQSQLEKLTQSVYHLHVGAHQAYQGYLREYALRNSKIFDVLALNIVDVAKSFGLSRPPKVQVELKRMKNRAAKTKENRYKSVSLRLATNEWAKKERSSQFKFANE